MEKIRDPKYRVLFSLIPFSGILFSLLKEKGIYEPFVLNLILLQEDQDIGGLVKYFQIFNRSNIMPASVDDLDKNIKAVLSTSKDEVAIFVGLHSTGENYYKSQKISRNLNYIAKKALNRSGLELGEHALQSVVVLLSNERIAQTGVINLFVERDFFNEDVSSSGQLDSIQAVLAMFVAYVEARYVEVEHIMTAEYEAKGQAEHYWKVLLALIKEFWAVYGRTLENVLGLPDDFSFDFLWEIEECCLEDAAETLIKVVYKAIRDIKVVSKGCSTGYDEVVYDNDSIWILPEAFSEMVDAYGMRGHKERLLLGSKEAGILQTSEYGGYTTRLQINGTRREYYRFQRKAFAKTGELDIIDMAREVE